MGLLNGNLVFAIIAAALGSGFQHGYHTGVINVPENVFREWISTTYGNRSDSKMSKGDETLIWSVTTSIMNVGGTIGGIVSGWFSTKLGPKKALSRNNYLMFLSCILMAVSGVSKSPEMLIVGRFLIGLNCGMNAGLCPMYLSEIAPVKLRGAVGSIYQLVITISILIAQCVGLKQLFGDRDIWLWIFVLPIVFGIIQEVMFLFTPESPKYIMAKGDQEKTTKTLQWLRKDSDVTGEMNELKEEDRIAKETPKVSLKDMWKTRFLRIPLIIAMMMMLAQQFSGINAVIFYSTSTFEKAGLKGDEPKFATIGIGAVNVVMTIVSVVLVEIAGRKTLLLVGFGGMAVITALLSLCLHWADSNAAIPYVCILLVFIYIILFASGAGSIPWFLVSEIFNHSARPTAVSLAVPTNWIANFIVTLSFPSVEKALKSFVFFIFVALDVLFCLFIWKFVPETKNKTIDEIVGRWK